MFEIDKEFTFEYGHRIWNQELDKELSQDSKCKCRFLHGHSGKIKVGLKSENLNNGMVLDFNELKWFKKWIDDNIDHRTIIDINDPFLENIIPNFESLWFVELDYFDKVLASKKTDLDELYDSFVFVDFIPTSENLARWFFNIVNDKLIDVPVDVAYVDFYETTKSHCRYKEED